MGRRDQFIEHLAQVPLFSALSRKELNLVARRAEDVVVPAGKVLVSEGETGQQFFVIMSGTATLTRRGRKIATLGPGDAFGELALLDKHPRNATAVADTPDGARRARSARVRRPDRRGSRLRPQAARRDGGPVAGSRHERGLATLSVAIAGDLA